MSAEEMAEMAYTILIDLGYESKHDWFNKRLFLSPNTEAFFSIFQFLLSYADPQKFREKFKFCIPLNEKRKEGEFRKILCSYLQELAANGDLRDDVPPIKMALFTSPGRSAFLQVLLSVIEWVLRRRSSSLGIIMPPYDESKEALSLVLDFYSKQAAADAKLADELLVEMRSQIELLVSDLNETHEIVRISRAQLTKAQQETKTLEEDEVNLRKFSEAVSEITAMSRPLQRILQIVQLDAPSRDALAIAELPPEVFLQVPTRLQPLIDELTEQISTREVDMVLYLKLITEVVAIKKPVFNDVLEKLSTGSAIERILEDQRSCLHRAEDLLSRLSELIEEKTASITDAVRDELEADEDSVILTFDPLSASELNDFVYLSEAELESATEKDTKSDNSTTAMPPPAQTNLRRKKIGLLNLPGSTLISADLSGISPMVTPIIAPRIAKLKSETRRRRSIKEVFTSTPIVRAE